MKHHIFLNQLTWSTQQTHDHLLKLNKDEQQQAKIYTHPLRLRAFVASRLMLKQALNLLNNTQQDWLFAKDQGRLIIRYPAVKWYISLTHSDDYLACLLSPQPYCGVDLEQRMYKPRFLAIAKRFFATDEFLHLNTLAEDQAFICFLDWWTRKEACIKAWHVGIAHHLNSIVFNHLQLCPIRYPQQFEHIPLQLHTISSPHLQIACAVNDTNPEWFVHHLTL